MTLENIKDILVARVNNLDSGKHDVMTEVKLVITERTKVEVRVLGIKAGVARLATEDSSVASEIRLQAHELLATINDRIKPEELTKLTIIVR